MPGDYPLENLGDERFQQLCQALLVRERPSVQCFPVGQPDGGRDAVAYLTGYLVGERRPFLAYQVKFSRTGDAEPNPRDWLRRALTREVSKVKRLAELGATEYVVMTNVAGTGHADVGSIDRIDDLFAESIPIPAFCMWRDDLARRLDGAWDLKWAYPEIMTGPDLLRAVIEAGIAADHTRRSNALRAFLVAQYFLDQQVRFRQVDLESPLLDLFIDVPLAGLAGERRPGRRRGKEGVRLMRAMVAVGHDLAAAQGAFDGPPLADDTLVSPEGDARTIPVASEDRSALTGRARSAGGHPLKSMAAEVLTISQARVEAYLRATGANRPALDQISLWADDDLDLLDEEAHVLLGADNTLGAVAFLAHPLAAREFPAIVLEGAPGQGKSTVTQFLCQIYRMRLLDKRYDSGRLAPAHKPRGARLPIRADLRDLAAWLGRRNPFGIGAGGASLEPPPGWEPTLESFLAALIAQQSGGARFDVSDLQEVARVSALLVVLDGLDEVADPKRRTAVVEAIREGTQRLTGIAAALQVIVTSRPAAFATSPGLPEAEFPRLQLGPVTKPLALEYADRWLAARRVAPREAEQFRTALKAKLDLPHLSELARNPMQLAILLSLLNTRGVSLPDKRTALYTSYIDVFFGREAEKSDTVRDNRDLLLSLHGYLAWLLHAEAETTEGDERGRITQERLRREVKTYLEAEGHDVTLVDGLFAGVVERVVALVSRVQGTFEFEVQPLREYFAGRYLYQTAKYSRVGDERLGGTKPDRFDQIARSPYWLNVTRFFAGFFDKGELPMLVERLKDLADDTRFRYTSHPASVAATLLSDWVFAQSPRTVSQVAALVLEPPRLKTFLAGSGERGAAGDPLSLSNECGRPLVVDRVFDLIRIDPPWDYRSSLISLLNANTSVAERVARWLGVARDTADGRRPSRHTWLNDAAAMQVLDVIASDDLAAFFRGSPPSSGEALLLARAGRHDVLAEDPLYAQAAVDGVLNGYSLVRPGYEPSTLIDALASALTPARYVHFEPGASIAWEELSRIRAVPPGEARVADQTSGANVEGLSPELADRVRAVVGRAAALARLPASDWATTLGPWDELVEASRAEFGERWAHVELAAEAALVRPERGRGVSVDRTSLEEALLDHSRPLVPRVWFARRRANAPEWWAAQIASATSDYDRTVVVALMCAWASSKVIEANAGALDDMVRTLASGRWYHLAALARRAWNSSHGRAGRRRAAVPSEESMGAARLITQVPRSDLDVRTLALLQNRFTPDLRRALFHERLQSYRGSDYYVLSWAQAEALRAFVDHPQDWHASLRTIAAAYAAGCHLVSEGRELTKAFHQDSGGATAADEVLANPTQYPQLLIAAAERRVREDIGARSVPVATAAQKEGWFEL